MQASVFIATSVDGFIARTNGDIDWLSGGNFDGAGEDYGYKAFMATVDALVMGRHTFEKVLTFGQWPYGSTPVAVLSSRGVAIPKAIAETVESMDGTPEEVVARLSSRGATHLYIDGGATIQRFLAAGLITRMTVTRIPILLGSGIPLFGPLPRDTRLRHIETVGYPSGLVQSKYDVVKWDVS
jgi:dihydrofolate reductase